MSYYPKSSSKPLFEPQIRITIQFCIPVANFSLIGLEIKTLWKNLIFDETSGLNSGLKLEMTSSSNNAYDITEKFLAYTLFLKRFIVVRHQMEELNWGGGAFCPPPVHYRGIPDPV